MGVVCQPQKRKFQKIKSYNFFNYQNVITSYSRHNTFGDVQKIRTKREGIYRFIMASNDNKIISISLQCRILSSLADLQLYDGTKFDLLDQTISPIMDAFNPDQNQIYHPIATKDRKQLLLKVYEFQNYRDPIFKNGLYQISLNAQLNSISPLLDYFIMSRGKANSLVMVFRRYEISLYEIMTYRWFADRFYWTEPQILTLWKSLLYSYRQLDKASICHSDIRLSTILYTSLNARHPYHLLNLKSAHKTNFASLEHQLIPVVGVNIFAEEPMKSHIQNKKDVALLNPREYDLRCLGRVFRSIVTLSPLQNQQTTRLSNAELNRIVERLLSRDCNLQQMQRQIELRLSQLDYHKNQLFKQDRIIAQHLTKSQLRLNCKDKIDQAYLNALLCLHKKQDFNRYVIKKLQENESQDRKQLNLQILHKIGHYYEQIGLADNQYYREEFALLLELAKQCRQQYFYVDHSHHLNRIQSILPQHQTPNSQLLRLKYHNELVHQHVYRQEIEAANKKFASNLRQLQGVLDVGVEGQAAYFFGVNADGVSNLALEVQLQILILKACLQMLGRRFESAEAMIEKISLVVSNGTLERQYEVKRYQGQTQFLRARYALQLMNSDYSQVKKRNISLAQVSLNNAANIFSNLPESTDNIIRLIDTYILQSDVDFIKSEYQQSKKTLEKAHLLSKEIEKHEPLSNILSLKIYEKLKIIYDKLNLTLDPFYDQIAAAISKNSQREQGSNAAHHRRTRLMRSKAKEGRAISQERRILVQEGRRIGSLRSQYLANSILQENEQQDD